MGENQIERIEKSIEIKKELLRKEFKRIREYVEKHPHEDPNFHELCDCWIKFGGLVREVQAYCEITGDYPLDEENKPCYYRNITAYDERLIPCREEIEKIETLRKIGDSEFLKENKACHDLYLYTIKYDSITGYIDGYSEEEQELLCNCISVPFFIYQKQQKNPDFKYSNRKEFLEMKLALLEFSLPDSDARIITMNQIIDDIDEKSVWYQSDNQRKESKTKPYTKK